MRSENWESMEAVAVLASLVAVSLAAPLEFSLEALLVSDVVFSLVVVAPAALLEAEVPSVPEAPVEPVLLDALDASDVPVDVPVALLLSSTCFCSSVSVKLASTCDFAKSSTTLTSCKASLRVVVACASAVLSGRA